jgi:hypothetical protein
VPSRPPVHVLTAYGVGSVDHQILRAVRHVDDFGQYLVRALVFRIVTDRILSAAGPGGGHGTASDPWEHTVDLADQLAVGGYSQS